AIYVPVIAGEERYLRQTFPEYEDYARHVPRFRPRLTRYGNQSGAFSSNLYWKHREYNATLGCLIVLAVLVFKLVR
ncbi:MAG: isoprenylcysteine carboxylmethyltransferase family protein, partial [Acidobacteriales bacterium]|nr:isoprenylcysteine carboxylmethyltransferase family protein [Terriglobales bacterium]